MLSNIREKRFTYTITAILSAILFTIFFYKKTIGINLFIFEYIMVGLILFFNRPIKFNFLITFILIAFIISSFTVLFVNSEWTTFVNITILLLLSTIITYKTHRSLFFVIGETIARFFTSHFKKFSTTESTKKITYLYKALYYIVIPVVLVLFFLLLYANASTHFYETLKPVLISIENFLESLNIELLFIFLLGLIFTNILINKTKQFGFLKIDSESSENLVRKKKKQHYKFNNLSLKTLNITGIVILFFLNLLILVFNILDVIYVWFYKWDGSFLKEFVHEGTWTLVFSAIIAALIVLYFFDGNINFYSKNKK